MKKDTAKLVYDNSLPSSSTKWPFTQETPTFNAWKYDEATKQCEDTSKPVYRYLNTRTGDTHFYAISQEEINALDGAFSNTFTREGIEFCAFETKVDGSVPVYRWQNKILGDTHFYTASEQERSDVDTKFADTFKYEGISFYAKPVTLN